MGQELTVLALSGLLQAGQFILFSVAANRELGAAITLSPRDDPSALALSVRTGRLQRAMNNHFEGLILFTLAVVVTTLGEGGSAFTALCAWIYFIARLAYVPAYWFGLVPWRSVIWMCGFGATVAMIIASLF